jgi:hypothetical protein
VKRTAVAVAVVLALAAAALLVVESLGLSGAHGFVPITYLVQYLSDKFRLSDFLAGLFVGLFAGHFYWRSKGTWDKPA